MEDAADEKQLEQFARQIAEKSGSEAAILGNRLYRKAAVTGWRREQERIV